MSNEHTDTDYDQRRDTDEHNPNPREEGKWLSALVALLGLWMIVQAVLFDLVASQVWNDVILGAALLALGGDNYSRRSDEKFGNVAAAGLAALLGLWLIITPFVFGADSGATEPVNDAGFWNDVLVGLAVTLIGAYSAYKARDRQTTSPKATTNR